MRTGFEPAYNGFANPGCSTNHHSSAAKRDSDPSESDTSRPSKHAKVHRRPSPAEALADALAEATKAGEWAAVAALADALRALAEPAAEVAKKAT